MKNCDKNKESLYLKYWDVSDLYECAMSQKLLVNRFKWVKNTSPFNKDFIKNQNEDIDEGYYLEIAVQYPENAHEFHNIYPFYLKE